MFLEDLIGGNVRKGRACDRGRSKWTCWKGDRRGVALTVCERQSRLFAKSYKRSGVAVI